MSQNCKLSKKCTFWPFFVYFARIKKKVTGCLNLGRIGVSGWDACGWDGKESASNVGDLSWIPGLGWSPGGGLGNPLQYSCLENPHGQRSLVVYSPWGRKESDTTERLSTQLKSNRIYRDPPFYWLLQTLSPYVDIELLCSWQSAFTCCS